MSLGSFRYVLAIFVLTSHLWAGMPQGFAAYAVWGFFLLSGFLMTLVLNEKYTFSTTGIKKYFYNRALRIYPMYWIAMILGSGTMLYLNTLQYDFKQLNHEFGFPDTLVNWVSNIVLLPTYFLENPVPVANALRIEVFYYFIIILLAIDKRIAWLGFFVGLVWNIYLLFISYSEKVDTFGLRYATLGPCSIAFAGGAILYHYKSFFGRFSNKNLSLITWMLNGLIWFKLPQYPWGIGIYISLALSAWVVISLYKEKANKMDLILGDLSYPVYLLHSTLGLILMPYFKEFRSIEFMFWGFILTNVISFISIQLVDQPIKKLKI
ncbi:acyltransferase [uncultured Cytophaga sp.]|uniref:acyltransferase family protein n=1 Tax=uncultured Cytophaga sp. TaxID=160238 RepID=UPI002601A206|nr:acyltransferase [uncultured Cytophaga sp.]